MRIDILGVSLCEGHLTHHLTTVSRKVNTICLYLIAAYNFSLKEFQKHVSYYKVEKIDSTL